MKRPSEVTVDDVVLRMLDLFDHLGVSSSRLALRFRHLRRKRPVNHAYTRASAIGEILTHWHQNPTYLDSSGKPLALRLKGRTPSFRALAESVVPNIAPSQLLAELKRLGAVTIDRKSRVRAKMRSLPVYVDRMFAVQHTLTSLDSYLKMLNHNLNSPPANANQLFHRVARNAHVRLSDIPSLKIRVKNLGQNFLESCDNWMTGRTKRVRRRGKNKIAQVSIGVYMSLEEDR